ncbi:thioredoxin domain-containing protein, partial [Candidatus Methylomirabilis sp.]|uniref:thioredoxin domain-containing protein n=1 Tax=Candidatus Methylomirabilis sp. TaxID=2032687 RepID=UPI003C74C9AF
MHATNVGSHEMGNEALPRHTNRLIHETSPYLLQHAHNPVDWYPWGEEAFRKAKEENKPILLSIGYSACHWCHVMAHESFEDEAIARLMNENFVCIKVDREERPDLDEIYLAATVALNQGHGGWPMTVFLAPDQQPFFAGTYFPPRGGLGRPGFPTILERIAQLWREQPDVLRTQSNEITERLREASRQPVPLPVGQTEVAQAVAHFAGSFDPVHGGFGPAPKFPAATGLSLLLRHHRRTGDAHGLHMVRTTLDA